MRHSFLGNNYAAIDANAASSFLSGSYWTSTEVDTNQAWRKAISGNSFATNSAIDYSHLSYPLHPHGDSEWRQLQRPLRGLALDWGFLCGWHSICRPFAGRQCADVYDTRATNLTGTPWNNNNGNDTASGQTSAVTGAAQQPGAN